MATLYLTELSRLQEPGAVPVVPPLASQTVTYMTSAQSSALNTETRTIQVYASAAAFLAFGADPTATAGGMHIPATTLVTIHYPRSDGDRKIAAYDGSS